MKRSFFSVFGKNPELFRKALFLLLSILLLSLTYFPMQACSAEITLGWNPNSEPSVTGYKLYYGESSRTYTVVTDVGNQTSYTCTELQEGTSYFFAVTAYDANNNESDYSVELPYLVPVANHSPVANDDTITTAEDTPITGTLEASDADGNSLTYGIVQQPSNGSVTITDVSSGAYTYTPNANSNGSDSFTFNVNDGSINSNTASVAITITSVNDAPTAVSDTVQVIKDTVTIIDVRANDSDIDGDTLSLTSAAQGAHGSTAVTNGKITYSPASGYTGTDAFTYTINDGKSGTATGTVTITITTGRRPLTASNSSLITVANTPVIGTMEASDADGGGLNYSIVNSPSKGIIEVIDATKGSFTYTPFKNATGVDSFTFKVHDGTACSNVAQVAVTIHTHVRVWLEAEEGTLNSPMEMAQDEKASGGEYAYVAKSADSIGKISNPDLAQGYGEYTFDVPIPATYVLFARVRSDTKAEKGFYVSVDNGGDVSWDAALGPKSGWAWDRVTDGEKSEPFSFHLEAGTHTLVIKQREDGAEIDKMLITTQPNFLNETVYEDAEDGTIGGWKVLDAGPPGAVITNVFDEDRQSNVIELEGSQSQNRYRLLSDSFKGWGNKKKSVIEWNLKYSENYTVFIGVQTTVGSKVLVYSPKDKDLLGEGSIVRLGLGSGSTDGRWHRFVRDLQADLEMAQPGVRITKVNSFSIRGSGRVDDIKLRPSL
jgi:hypothetical protein